MTTDIRERIDAALAGTTPGPWHWSGPSHAFIRTHDTAMGPPGEGDYAIAASMPNDPHRLADAALIAAAPTLLAEARAALDEVESLRAEVEQLRAGWDHMFRGYLRVQGIPDELIDKEIPPSGRSGIPS